MKPFLRDILFTFLLCLSLIDILEIAIGNTTTTRSYKDWYMTEYADKIKILLQGNSLFENSFDPHVLGDSVFDAASAGRNIYYDLNILKKYAPQMNNLLAVIIPLDVSLYESRVGLFNQYFYAKYMGISAGHNPFQYSALFSGHISLHSFASDAKGSRLTMDSSGYIPIKNQWDGTHDDIYSISPYEEVQPRQESFVSLITEMAQYCIHHGIRLIVVLPPLSDLQYNLHDPRLFNSLDSIMSTLQKTNILVRVRILS